MGGAFGLTPGGPTGPKPEQKALLLTSEADNVQPKAGGVDNKVPAEETKALLKRQKRTFKREAKMGLDPRTEPVKASGDPLSSTWKNS